MSRRIVGTYQDTPEASKNNAFCWKTWEGQIDWSTGAPQGRPKADTYDISQRQTRVIEQRRAQGHDMLHVAGLNSELKVNLRQFAIAMPPARKVA